jgi:hypothetical protein
MLGRADGPPGFFAGRRSGGCFLDADREPNPSCARAVPIGAQATSRIEGMLTMTRRLPWLHGTVAAFLASMMLLGVADPAAARARSPLALVDVEPSVELFPAQRGGVSLAEATAIATSRYRGRVVRAETVSRGDRVVHEIRILGDDGRVRTVRIDAQTGSFL